jgi:hypothetical protein
MACYRGKISQWVFNYCPISILKYLKMGIAKFEKALFSMNYWYRPIGIEMI